MTEKRALITGAQGFCGRHLVAHLQNSGYEVYGLDARELAVVPGVRFYRGDIRDRDWAESLLREIQPTHLFHLAAVTSPEAGWEVMHDVNVHGTGELLEAVRRSGLDPVIVVTGSSAAYGAVESTELPIGESQAFRPVSLYAVSKIAQEMLAYTHYARYGTRVIRTRTFNLTGPGESPTFVTSAFAHQIVEVERGRREALKVGNLTSVRDLTDVRDVVRAYRLLAECGQPGEVYNVCSGHGTAIRQVLDWLLALSSTSQIRVEQDPTRLQAGDVPVQVGDATRLRQATGWLPEIPLRQTLADVLEHWRQTTA